MVEYFGGKDSLPSCYSYSPLPSCLKLDISDISGYGIFAKEDIPAGTKLGLTHISIFCIIDDADTDYLSEDNTHGVIRTPLGAYLNHKKDCNGHLTADISYCLLYLVCDRHIDAGEEITVDYNQCLSMVDKMNNKWTQISY